ncbi:MAG TPA: tail fiber domain-containing protein [Thermoanaerobaculia bacterium]|nr:tail fiber domain-containing protein [Thermoanaerobaculia bacterium]
MAKQRLSVCVLALMLVVLCLPVHGAEVARVQVTPSQVQWEPQVSYERLVLTVSMPGGAVVRREFAAGQAPVFALPRGEADGSYSYELRVVPTLDPEVRKALAASREPGGAVAVERLRKAGRLPAGDLVQSGSFTAVGGALVVPEGREERTAPVKKGGADLPVKDQVIADDLIVQGSACIGLDCVANESFGFDTIRLKENSTRIKFEDTSVGSFPSTDWQLTANDSASGGANKFSIEDITGSKVPFTITAGAATNSIFVDSTGRLGLRTSTPVLDIHVSTSNTPAMRLEQNNSGGFTAQTWDVAGNEANFFVRDVTGGSRLPFRIRPGAPTSSIDINASGNVGIGTASPSTKLHVSGSDGTTKLLVQESSATATAREMAEFRNNGGAEMIFKDTGDTARWSIGTFSSAFIWDNQAVANVEMTLGNTGNLTITGMLSQGSDRNTKTDIFDVQPDDVLAKVDSLPISTWRYKGDAADVHHLGPMAQDFSAAFGLGQDDRHIAPLDAAGVSLAAIQALNRKVTEKQAAIEDLARRNADLEKRLADLETLVAKLAPAVQK